MDMGTDENGFSYKKYANGEAEWRKKITFTTPEWSGQPNLYYCNVNVYEVPENVEEYGAMRFVPIDESGANAHVSIIAKRHEYMLFSMARFYGGSDAIEITGEFIINGKWK